MFTTAQRPIAKARLSGKDAYDLQVAEMRRLLTAMATPSAAAALKVLREAFPDSPLSMRIKALGGQR